MTSPLDTFPPSQPCQRYHFKFEARDALPSLDLAKTVEEVLLAPWFGFACNRYFDRHVRVVQLCYTLSIALRVTSIIAPAPIGRVLAFASPILQFPATFSIVLSLRVAYIRLLVGTFDFAYYLLLNTMWMVTFALLLRDTRICLVPFMWAEFQCSTLMDAYFRKHTVVVVAGVVIVMQLFALVGAVVFNQIDATSHVVLFSTAYRSLTTRDVLLYTTEGVMFLSARFVYRRRAAVAVRRSVRSTQKRNAITQAVPIGQQPPQLKPRMLRAQSIVYRSKLVLVEEIIRSTPRGLVINPTPSANTNPSSSGSAKLMYLVPSASVLYRLPRQWCRCLVSLDRALILATAVTSLVATAVSFKAPTTTTTTTTILADVEEDSMATASVVAVAATVVFMVYCAQYYSVQLLRRWLTSFDAVVLSFKVAATHLITCDMFSWQLGCCLPILCSWLWWQWVLTVDALPPVSKMRLGIQLRVWVLPLLLISLLSQILLVGELLFWNKWRLRDRELIRLSLHGEELVFMACPLLLSRLVTVFVWTWRLIYRVVTSKNNNELLLLSGTVECDVPSKPTVNASKGS